MVRVQGMAPSSWESRHIHRDTAWMDHTPTLWVTNTVTEPGRTGEAPAQRGLCKIIHLTAFAPLLSPDLQAMPTAFLRDLGVPRPGSPHAAIAHALPGPR